MNKQWLLARTPPGGLPTAEDFTLVETPILSLAQTRCSHAPSTSRSTHIRQAQRVEEVGEVCHGRTVSQVVKSNVPEYNEGDFIFNTNGWQEYGLTGEGISVFGYMFPRKLDPTQAPISTAVGIMGMLGLTAYSGMALQCQPGPVRRW